MTTINSGDSQTVSGSQSLEAPINVAGELNVSDELNIDTKLGISGIVIDSSNNPVVGVSIDLFLQDGGSRNIQTVTDSNGEYAFTSHPDATGAVQTWHLLASDENNGELFNARSQFGVRASLEPTP